MARDENECTYPHRVDQSRIHWWLAHSRCCASGKAQGSCRPGRRGYTENFRSTLKTHFGRTAVLSLKDGTAGKPYHVAHERVSCIAPYSPWRLCHSARRLFRFGLATADAAFLGHGSRR